MKNRKNRIKIISILALILSIGPITWIVYGNEEKDIAYSIQEELTEESTIARLTLEVTASDKVVEVSKIVLPDGSIVERQTSITYEVKENGEYKFVVQYKIQEENENKEVIEVEKEETISYQEENIKRKQEKPIDDEPPISYATGDIVIDETNFPDDNFRYYLLTNTSSDQIKGYGTDGTFTTRELADIKTISVGGKSIKDVKGIEYFTAITHLKCEDNQLTTLDISQNTALTYLSCYTNQLTELDVSKNTALSALDCSGNHLTTLDLSKNTKLEFSTSARLHGQTREIPMYPSGEVWKSDGNIKYELGRITNPNITYDSTEGQFTALNNSTTSTTFTTIISNGSKEFSIEGTLNFNYIDGIEINEVNFPDPNFSDYVKTLPGAEDGVLTASELENIKTIMVASTNIASLEGIEYFTALKDLRCNGNNLKELDISKNTALISMSCDNNQLKNLDISKNISLIYFYCSGNQLTELDVSKNISLIYFYCSGNQLTELDVSKNAILETFYCNGNQLTTIDLSQNTKLTTVKLDSQTKEIPMYLNGGIWESDANIKYEVGNIGNNNITYNSATGRFSSLDQTANLSSFGTNCVDSSGTKWIVSGALKFTYASILINEANFPDPHFLAYVKTLSGAEDGVLTSVEIADIKIIDVNNSNITSLKGVEYFTALTTLYCYGNELKELDITRNTNLLKLNCSENKLGGLDVRNNKKLNHLDCRVNEIKELNVAENVNLTYLDCGRNQIKSLNVQNNPELLELACYTNLLTNLDLSNQSKILHLSCSTNQLEELDVSSLTSIQSLSVFNNYLTKLDVSNISSLKNLWAYTNKLKYLNTKNCINLEVLNCSNNQLVNLDIRDNLALANLDCSNNQLTIVDLSQNTKLTTAITNKQRREISMNFDTSQWNSDINIKYEVGNIENNNITYNSTTGQFTTSTIANTSSNFTTDCIDGMGTRRQVSGMLHFNYEGFIPVSNIKNIPDTIKPGETLTLGGAIEPSNATVAKVIEWSIKDAGETGAMLIDRKLTVQRPGTITLTATITGGTQAGDYIQDFIIVALEKPSALVCIPTNIQLKRKNDENQFEAVKEEEVSILPTINTDIYNENFYIQTNPSFHLMNTSNSDEWFIVQIYDEGNNKHTSDTPLAILNCDTRKKSFFVKVLKDMTRGKGIYEGTMNFIIGYGEVQ